MKVKMKLDVYIHDEHFDEIPDFAYVEIDEEFIDRILHLHKVMKENKIDKVANYDYTPTFMVNETDENYKVVGEKEYEDFRTECEMLNIVLGSVYWSFLVKHTDINGNVDSISIEDLKTMKKAMTMPIEDLPTFINDESKIIQYIVKERMNVPAL